LSKYRFVVLLSVLFTFISCKQEVNEKPMVNNAFTTKEMDSSSIDSNDLQSKLQGKWKRIDYPFSRYEFKGDTAKLISEGQARTPEFEPYELSKNCRFSIEENVELESDELILIHPNNIACELISVNKDTLYIGALDRSYSITYISQ